MTGAASTILLPISWAYGLAAAARNRAFDTGVLRISRAPVPVIAVGNMTAGGTGKTPLVEDITRRLGRRGLSVAVVSRGYGRSSHGVVVVSRRGEIRADARSGGDEPVQIARKFPLASVVVGERRIDAARAAVEECGAEVIVLDDGFQHRAIARDLDIVVVDCRKSLPRERLLPSGMRRERLAGLGRADLLGFSRAAGPDDPHWAGELSRWTDARSFAFKTVITGFAPLGGGAAAGAESMRGKRVLAFSGIGSHEAFAASLAAAGVEVVAEKAFRDHHRYSVNDIDAIVESSRGAESCVTTEKDMVRLLAEPGLLARTEGSVPFAYAEAAIGVLRGEEVLERALDDALEGRRVR